MPFYMACSSQKDGYLVFFVREEVGEKKGVRIRRRSIKRMFAKMRFAILYYQMLYLEKGRQLGIMTNFIQAYLLHS